MRRMGSDIVTHVPIATLWVGAPIIPSSAVEPRMKVITTNSLTHMVGKVMIIQGGIIAVIVIRETEEMVVHTTAHLSQTTALAQKTISVHGAPFAGVRRAK